MLLSYQWVIEEITKEIKNFFEINENENTVYQILCDTTRTILRGKFITALSAYIKKRNASNEILNDAPQWLRKIRNQTPKTTGCEK